MKCRRKCCLKGMRSKVDCCEEVEISKFHDIKCGRKFDEIT